MQTLFFVGEERSVSKPRWNAVSDCLEVSLCLRELLRCHCEFFVEHLKFVLPGTGGAWLMAVGAQARQAAFSGSTNTHSSESSWAKMLQMTFLSEMFAAEKKKSPFQLLTLRLKALMEFALLFFLHLSWGKGGNGGDGKERVLLGLWEIRVYKVQLPKL